MRSPQRNGGFIKKYNTILIIDDEQEIGSLLSEVLEPLFEKVLYCASAIEALKVAKSTALTVILSDFTMPILSGDQFLLKLRAENILTPIIFLTGLSTVEVMQKVSNIDTCSVFEKPISFEEIFIGVEQVLESKKIA